MSSTNGRYTINMYEDNSFHIKVNRYQNQLPNKNPNHNSMNPQSYNYMSKAIPKSKKDDLFQNKIRKNKNKLYELSSSSNLSRLSNKQKLNKIRNNNSLRVFQKENSEKSIIDTLSNIRNSHRRFSNKVNGSNTNNNYSLQNINLNKYFNENSINDYRSKVMNNKNKLNNPLIKTTSFKNEFNNLKNMSKSSFNYYTNNIKNNINNNFLIDDTTSNDTDLLTESGVNNTKETNLYVYRSEVQYPVKNIISNTNYMPNDNHDNYNYLTLKTFNNDKYKKNVLFGETNSPNENNSKSLANSRTKRIIENSEYESESYYLSPLPEPDYSKNRKTIKNYMTQNMINKHIDAVSVNKEKKFSERTFNNNEDSFHQFKKCYSRDKYGYRFDNFMERGNFDIILSNKSKKIYPSQKANKINNKLERNNKFLKSNNSYNINNNKFLNQNRTKSKINNQKTKIIPIFCDYVEKYLISVIKNNFKFFIQKMNKYIEIRSCKSNYNYYAPINDDKNININNLLLKRFNNKKLNKKVFGLEKNSIPFDTSRKKLDPSRSENKMLIFKINSRNNNFNSIYQKKSNSINKSLNLNSNNNNFIINNYEDDYDDDYMIKKLKKRKNLSFNKVYVPKHKNAKKNMYKNLEINTFNDNEKDINNNNISNNNINYISKTNSNTNNNTNNNSFIQNNKVYQTISGGDTIIKKINHITALKRKYINKKNYNNNNSVNSSNSNMLHNSTNKIIQELSNLSKKSNITKKNIYSKPLFNKIRNKILEKESERLNFNSAKKIPIATEDKNKLMNGLLYNSNKKININDNNNNNKNDYIEKNKKVLKINKKNKETKENRESKENKDKKNILKNFVLTKKKINYSNNNNIKNSRKNASYKKEKNQKKDNLKNIETKKDDSNEKEKEKEKENIETKNDNENDNDNDMENYDIIRSIIVKDVRSRDKILNVFIKYYECNFPKSNKNNCNFHQLAVISTDSLSIVSTNSNKSSKKENNKTNIYLHQILTSIIEEDEKSKANPSMNNSNSVDSVISEEESEKHNTNQNNSNNNMLTHNIVIYLTNILQNLYDDNKKMILYSFMKNLKKIQNQLYLKSSLMQFNLKNGIKDEVVTNNNSTFNNNNCIENQKIIYNGKNEVEISSKDRNNSSKKIYFYTADNSFIELNKDHKNKNNILIGSLSFKDFEIKDEDEIIKPKKYMSSSSLNKVKINGSMLSYEMNEKKNKYDTKNKLKNIISLINKKIIINYFNSWKKIKNVNFESNGIEYQSCYMDNGMNVSDKDNGRNYLNEKIVEINNDDLSGNGEVKFFDNGIDIEYEDMEIKNTEINKEVLKNYEIMEKINLFRYFLIKSALNKKL